MKIELKFPVKSSMKLADSWPLQSDDMTFSWEIIDEEVKYLKVVLPASADDRIPTINKSDTPGIKAHITPGYVAKLDDIEKRVLTLQGLLNLFTRIEFDRETVETTWIPESDEERSQLSISSYSVEVQKLDMDTPRPLLFEMVARSFFSIDRASTLEIPLNFLRRAQRCLHEDRYIESYYYYFFVLETLFAPGLSNPKRVVEKLFANPEVLSSIERVKGSTDDLAQQSPEVRKLLRLDNRKLLEHFVKVRGNLHHHSPKGPSAWHPEKAADMKADCHALSLIVHRMLLSSATYAMYTEDVSKELFKSAEKAEALTELLIEGTCSVDGVVLQLRPVKMTIPGTVVSRAMIEKAHESFRAHLEKNGVGHRFALIDFSISGADGSKYASYSASAPQLVTTDPKEDTHDTS